MKNILILITALFGTSQSFGQAVIKTISGDGVHAFSGDGGACAYAEFQYPSAICTDPFGNIYILDVYNGALREINATSGIITTIAGSGTYNGNIGDGGLAISALLFEPYAVCTDASGNIYIADFGNRKVREIYATTGIINTIAGNGTSGASGDGGPATNAELNPSGVAVDDSGNVYIAEYQNNKIRKVSAATGMIHTIAGNGVGAFSGDGGKATLAELDSPTTVAVDHSGNVYIADDYNLRIRKINASTGIINTYAGNGLFGDSGDGSPATNAKFSDPYGVYVDNLGNVYIADQVASVIRKITATTGLISTVAGNGTPGFSGDDSTATNAEINYATGVCTNAKGNIIYIADKINARIRKVYDPSASSVKELQLSPVNAFPNPSRGNFIIQTGSNQLYNLTVLNSIGECVYKSTINTVQTEIDLTNQPEGIYILHLQSEKNLSVQKLIIIK